MFAALRRPSGMWYYRVEYKGYWEVAQLLHSKMFLGTVSEAAGSEGPCGVGPGRQWMERRAAGQWAVAGVWSRWWLLFHIVSGRFQDHLSDRLKCWLNENLTRAERLFVVGNLTLNIARRDCSCQEFWSQAQELAWNLGNNNNRWQLVSPYYLSSGVLIASHGL